MVGHRRLVLHTVISSGVAIDYLYGLAQQASAGVLVEGKPVMVVDGQPVELAFGMFVVGLTQPPPDPAGEASGTRSWAELGAGRLQEDYTIPCYIDVRVSGAVQKKARDQALALFDAFWQLLAADLTLGGVLAGGRYAEIINLTSTPTAVGTAAEEGRRQLVTFDVHCRNLTT